MSRDDTPTVSSDRATGRTSQLWIFVAATFLSAFLLFLIQPLFTKMVLPLLGGSPSVWAVALCFFQAALLAGYLYAHGLTARFAPATAGALHLGLIAIAFIALPISVPAGWQEPPSASPYLWQLGLFAVAIGLPFVAVAANAPLLQAWFSRTGHAHASDPYFMYAASNLGSLLALLGYPLLLEPVFGTRLLSNLWSAGFVLLWGAIAAAYWQVRVAAAQPAVAVEPTGDNRIVIPEQEPTWRSRAGWVGLAFVPSALLTAVTTHVATDVASAPLLWVLPLALYLLTYVLVFRKKALVPERILLMLHLIFVIVALFELAQSRNENWFLTAAAGVAAFFTSAMVAHRTLYESRPAAIYLTEFYLWMATGGVLGGAFAALVAPQLFSEVFEYPILLALTMACRPHALSSLFLGSREWIRALATAAIAVFVMIVVPRIGYYFDFFFWGWGPAAAIAAIFASAALAFYKSPTHQFIAVAMMCLTVVTFPSLVKRGDAERSFFGVYRVKTADDGKFKILLHGTTLHGAQRVRDNSGALVLDLTPTTYYHPDWPMGSVVRYVSENTVGTGRVRNFGVIGLGTGSLACLAMKNERWHFFEIDPLVLKIASKPIDFSFLRYCPPAGGIKIGDARLTLAKEADGSYDLLVIDAFSSDAVPVHLMTKEALELYMTKLRPDGVLMLHISNRYLDLEAVVAATSRLMPDLKGVIISKTATSKTYDNETSTIAVLVRDKKRAAEIAKLENAKPMKKTRLRGWTDDYSDILRPMISELLD